MQGKTKGYYDCDIYGGLQSTLPDLRGHKDCLEALWGCTQAQYLLGLGTPFLEAQGTKAFLMLTLGLASVN